MKNPNTDWLKNLNKQNFITPFDTGIGKYHRLVNPSCFTIPDDKVSILISQYNPGFEKGGLFLFSYERKKDVIAFMLEEIIFIKNVSPMPWACYEADLYEYRQAMEKALEMQLIPCFFHSHPTKASNILFESFAYNRQMDTSDADKVASLYPAFAEGLNLRLPEFLVVCNGSLKNGIFIGIYGGLIAPLDFSQRKKDLMDSFVENAIEDVSNFFNTPQKKIFGVLGGAGLLLLGIKYPKAILPVLATTVAVMPSIIYETPYIHEFFGISHGSKLEINIPKTEDLIIIADENKIHKLQEEINKRNQYSEVA